MIFKITSEDFRMDYFSATDLTEFIKEYSGKYDLDEVKEIEIISDNDAKDIKIINEEYDGKDDSEPEYFFLSELVGSGFELIATNEF